MIEGWPGKVNLEYGRVQQSGNGGAKGLEGDADWSTLVKLNKHVTVHFSLSFAMFPFSL